MISHLPRIILHCTPTWGKAQALCLEVGTGSVCHRKRLRGEEMAGQDEGKRVVRGPKSWMVKKAKKGHLAWLAFVPSLVFPRLVKRHQPEGPSSAGAQPAILAPLTPPLGTSV